MAHGRARTWSAWCRYEQRIGRLRSRNGFAGWSIVRAGWSRARTDLVRLIARQEAGCRPVAAMVLSQAAASAHGMVFQSGFELIGGEPVGRVHG